MRHTRLRSAAVALLLPLAAAACSSSGTRTGERSSEASGRAGAATAGEVVDAFLAAEIRGDSAASFAMLSAADRASYRSAGEWEAVRADLPRYRRAAPAVDGDGRPETLVELEPRLDPVVGFVPARASVRWGAVEEDGRWFVDLATTELEPQLPSDASAADAALAWVTSRQACRPDEPEVEGGIVGSIRAADALCGLEGAPRAGVPSPLSDLANRGDVLAAFGAGADTWARVIPITGPAPLDVVVGPLGDDWVVVATLAR